MNVFEKIKEKLKEKSVIVATSEEYWDNPQNGECVEEAVFLKSAISIVNQIAEEFATDTNVGNKDGWIPVSSGKLPEEPKAINDDIEDMILDGKLKEYNVTIQGATKATTLYYAGDGYWYDDTTQDYYPVTAWQYLPSAYEPPGEPNWQNHMMNRFMREN